MRTVNPNLPPVEELANLLMELRRTHPENLEDALRHCLPDLGEDVLAARRKHLSVVPLEHLFLSRKVRDLLVDLRRNYQVCLFTTGQRELQQAKIERLGLRDLCDEIVIIDSDSEASKETAFDYFLKQHGYDPHKVLILGNRLDNEIRAGNRLGMPTVWIQHGEGSAHTPGSDTGHPDLVLSDLLRLPDALNKFFGKKGGRA